MDFLEVGSKAPDFTLPNQDGKNVCLAEQAGKNVLIWFYPRAFGNN
jgi:peroxiredoxin Q/BCP